MKKEFSVRVRRTHITVLEGTHLSIKWYLVQAKLGHGQLGNYELITNIELASADVKIGEYIRGIRDDVCTELAFAKLVLRPHIVSSQSEVGYNGSPAFLLATFSRPKGENG